MSPKFSIYIAASLDGFIAKEDGSVDWLATVEADGEDYGFKAFIESVDTVVMGRKTYETAITALGTDHWPYGGKRLIVLSRTMKQAVPEFSLYTGELRDLPHYLAKRGSSHVWVDGGSTLSQCMDLGVVDTLTLSIIPTLLGSGIPLFSLNSSRSCQLQSSQSYPSGLVQLQYNLVKP